MNRASGVFSLLPHFEQVMRDYPGVDIVVSSTWREAYSIEELRSVFSEDFRSRLVDVTPIVASAGKPHVREIEILSWLRETGREYEAWLALDDSPWLFSPNCQNLILVDTNVGFSVRTEQALRKLLDPYWQS
ncbi:hypothetical protein FB599_2864 [Herbaspirillum sp. SJZ130]|nr:hypothetical protein FB599_2864 [Herbaspirillum sp. SJZ130]TQK09903.1 hypothetical protein FB598_2898 [Herbaspirillum sp. SJZ106]